MTEYVYDNMLSILDARELISEIAKNKIEEWKVFKNNQRYIKKIDISDYLHLIL